jgi:hypothetical protein
MAANAASMATLGRCLPADGIVPYHTDFRRQRHTAPGDHSSAAQCESTSAASERHQLSRLPPLFALVQGLWQPARDTGQDSIARTGKVKQASAEIDLCKLTDHSAWVDVSEGGVTALRHHQARPRQVTKKEADIAPTRDPAQDQKQPPSIEGRLLDPQVAATWVTASTGTETDIAAIATGMTAAATERGRAHRLHLKCPYMSQIIKVHALQWFSCLVQRSGSSG